MSNIFEKAIGGLWDREESNIQRANGGVQHVGRNLGNSLGSVWDKSLGSDGLFGKFDNWYGGSGGEAATKLGLAAIAAFGALGAAGGSAAGTSETGAGGYTVLDGMPPLGNGTEGGAMDMFGSQSSPTDASTVFDQSPHGPMNSSLGQYRPQGNMGGGQRQPYMGLRPHDYLAYLQGQPPQQPFAQPPLGQGTFWGGGQSPMTKGLFGYG